jgi:hypothetical protein
VGRREGGRIRRCQGRDCLPPVLADEPDVLQNGLQGRHTHRGARSEGGPTKGPALQAAHKGYADAFQACLSSCFKAGQSARMSAHGRCSSKAQKLVTVPASGLQIVGGEVAPQSWQASGQQAGGSIMPHHRAPLPHCVATTAFPSCAGAPPLPGAVPFLAVGCAPRPSPTLWAGPPGGAGPPGRGTTGRRGPGCAHT